MLTSTHFQPPLAGVWGVILQQPAILLPFT
jgi:hypothetical protein